MNIQKIKVTNIERVQKVGVKNAQTIVVNFDLQEKVVTPTTEQQIITQDEEYDALSQVTVNSIPEEYIIPTGTININSNGVTNVSGYENANVNIINEINLQNKNVIPNKELQEITADTNYDGLEKVSVQPIPSEYIIPSGEINITENGQYDVTEKASVNVEVSSNGGGTGANIEEYFDLDYIIGQGTNRVFSWAYCIKNLPPLKCTTGTSLTYAFYSYRGESLDLSRFDTSNVTNMSYMFNACNSITSLDLRSFNTEQVTTMLQMFYGCVALENLDISSFRTPALTTMQQMFYNCKKLKALDFSGFNTEKVTTMANIFYQCFELTSLDLSSFNTPVLTNVQNMFAYCTKLTHIDMRNFDFTNVTTYSQMFGVNSTTGVPNSCEIIVKDDVAKEWITSKNTRLTNVKTIEEYETE